MRGVRGRTRMLFERGGMAAVGGNQSICVDLFITTAADCCGQLCGGRGFRVAFLRNACWMDRLRCALLCSLFPVPHRTALPSSL